MIYNSHLYCTSYSLDRWRITANEDNNDTDDDDCDDNDNVLLAIVGC